MLSIICPIYNEKDNLKILIDRLSSAVSQLKIPYEVLLVDDGSNDGGVELLKTLAAPQAHFRVLELIQNKGITTALYAGFQNAKGDVLAALDADLQNPPEEIPRLLELLVNYDMVTGVRTKRQDTFVKQMSSKIANGLRRAVIKDSIADTACSLKVFRREVFENSFLPYKGMHRFYACIAQHLGYKILQVPVKHELRQFGKAKYGLFNRILGPLWDLIAIRWILTHKIQYRLNQPV